MRSCSGHSGHGVCGARSSGGSGMISNWWTEAAFWRWQVPRQSAPVSPPPMITTRLPVAEHGRLAVDPVARAEPVLLRQKIHGEVDAVQLAAGNVQIARMLGAAGQQNGVELRAKVFHRDVAADVRVGPEHDAFRYHLLQAAVQELLFQLEIGNAVAQQAAGAVRLFEDGDRSGRRGPAVARRPGPPDRSRPRRRACRCAAAAARAGSSLHERRAR